MDEYYFDQSLGLRRECLKYFPRARILPENNIFKHKPAHRLCSKFATV